jgi:hypothetical protein
MSARTLLASESNWSVEVALAFADFLFGFAVVVVVVVVVVLVAFAIVESIYFELGRGWGVELMER